MKEKLISSKKERLVGVIDFYSKRRINGKKVLDKVKEEVDRITDPPRYDVGLSCGLTYHEENKLNQIRDILNGRELEHEKLIRIDRVLKQNNNDSFCLTSYSNKLNGLKSIVEFYLKQSGREEIQKKMRVKYNFNQNDKELDKTSSVTMSNSSNSSFVI